MSEGTSASEAANDARARQSRASIVVGAFALLALLVVIAAVASRSFDNREPRDGFAILRNCENARGIRTKFEPGLTGAERLAAVEGALEAAGASALSSKDLPKQRVVATLLCEANAAAGEENRLAEVLRDLDHVEKAEIGFITMIEN